MLTASDGDKSGEGDFFLGVEGCKESVCREIREGDNEVTKRAGGGFAVVGD